jgi:hypothetical protein
VGQIGKVCIRIGPPGNRRALRMLVDLLGHDLALGTTGAAVTAAVGKPS